MSTGKSWVNKKIGATTRTPCSGLLLIAPIRCYIRGVHMSTTQLQWVHVYRWHSGSTRSIPFGPEGWTLRPESWTGVHPLRKPCGPMTGFQDKTTPIHPGRRRFFLHVEQKPTQVNSAPRILGGPSLNWSILLRCMEVGPIASHVSTRAQWYTCRMDPLLPVPFPRSVLAVSPSSPPCSRGRAEQ